MKKFNTVATISALSLGAGVLAATAPQSAFARGKDKHAQNVTVTVDGKGYHPAMVNVKAGREVHMTFVSKGASCANEVRIPALKKTFSLKPGRRRESSSPRRKGKPSLSLAA